MWGVREFEAAHQRIYEAQDEMSKIVARRTPPGATIEWDHGGHAQLGHVINTGSWRCILVKNDKTGKELFIAPYQVISVRARP